MPRLLPLAALMALAACATQVRSAVATDAPGVPWDVWQGFIFPMAWVLSLFLDNVAVQGVPTNSGWDDFGVFIGVVFLGVGARKSHVVYRERVVVRR